MNKEFEGKDAPFMGVLAAFIFAAQMLNFPVAGGTSGHFVGGALAAILLGPWKAMLVMLSVVSVQALLFGDGGITALGVNILNMAIMTGWHLLIGGGEGFITMTTVSYLARVRPDLLKSHAGLDLRSLLIFSGAAALIALVLSPFASSFPDGLEKVAHTLGFIKHETSLFKALIPDYSMPGFGDGGLATGLAGFVGVLVTIFIGYGTAKIVRRRTPKG